MNSSTSSSKIKKYVVYPLWFILCVLLFDRGLFLLVTTLETHFYSQNQFEKRFAKYVKDKQFNTLIFGTSRSYEAIHPYYLEKELGVKAFKETFQGKGPKYNLYFYRLFKKYCGIPKVVIYGVDYFIYAVESDPKYMARFDLKAEKKINYFTTPLLLLKYKNRIDNFQNNILIRLTEKKNPDAAEESVQDFIDIQKYRGANIANKDKKLITKQPAEYLHQFFIQYPGSEGPVFKKLLDELDQDKVTVIFVLLPDYFGSYKTNFQQRFFISEMNKMRKHCKRLFIYNYNLPGKFPLRNQDYFIDGGWGQANSHLSQAGAEVLNELLARDIRKHYQ